MLFSRRSNQEYRYRGKADIWGESLDDRMNSVKEYFPATKTAIIASGEEFADALVAAPYAAKIDAPISLVRKDRLSATVKEYLLSTSITDYKVIGGDAAASEELRTVIESMRD